MPRRQPIHLDPNRPSWERQTQAGESKPNHDRFLIWRGLARRTIPEFLTAVASKPDLACSEAYARELRAAYHWDERAAAFDTWTQRVEDEEFVRRARGTARNLTILNGQVARMAGQRVLRIMEQLSGSESIRALEAGTRGFNALYETAGGIPGQPASESGDQEQDGAAGWDTVRDTILTTLAGHPEALAAVATAVAALDGEDQDQVPALPSGSAP